MRTETGEPGLWEMARAFQSSRILLSGIELGVFAALGNKPRTSEEVAAQIQADQRATNRIMSALVAIGLLVRHDDLFGNSPDAEDYLVPGKPGYMGDALLHAASMWTTWSTLTDAVRAGRSVYRPDPEAQSARLKAFIAAMHYNARLHAPALVNLIDFSNVSRMVDVGGGSAAYSIAFCRAKKDLESVVFDLPDVVNLAKGYVSEAGLSKRITTRPGDYLADDLGSGYDMAWLSQIIHSNGVDQNIELFKRCFRALNPGGRIMLQDFIVEPSRTRPANAAIFSLNMLVATHAGDTYTQAEVEDWFGQAGFADFTRIDPPGDATVLLSARKP